MIEKRHPKGNLDVAAALFVYGSAAQDEDWFSHIALLMSFTEWNSWSLGVSSGALVLCEANEDKRVSVF